MREPFAARWPGRIPAGTVSLEPGSTLDFFPTLVRLAGGTIPHDRPYDGTDLMPVLQGGPAPERTIYYYRGEHLRALRKGKWKIHFSYQENNYNDFDAEKSQVKWITPEQPLLFNLDEDPSERFNLASEYPQSCRNSPRLRKHTSRKIRQCGENQDLIDWFIRDWAKAPGRRLSRSHLNQVTKRFL
jgi:arylsulfatase A-like enzyme